VAHAALAPTAAFTAAGCGIISLPRAQLVTQTTRDRRGVFGGADRTRHRDTPATRARQSLDATGRDTSDREMRHTRKLSDERTQIRLA